MLSVLEEIQAETLIQTTNVRMLVKIKLVKMNINALDVQGLNKLSYVNNLEQDFHQIYTEITKYDAFKQLF